MGWFNKLKHSAHKLGNKVVSGAHSIGKLAGKVDAVGSKVIQFAEKKALPIAEKVASGLNKGLKIATPLVGSFAPELLPALMGAQKLSGLADKGLKKAEQGVEALKAGQMKARQVAGAVNSSAKTVQSGASAGFRGDLQGVQSALTRLEGDVAKNPLKR